MLGAVPPPPVRTARSGPTTLSESIEHVIRGIVQEALERSRQRAGGAVDAATSAGEGDELTEAYVRAAAKAAADVPDAYRSKALCLGLAVALGDAESLAANPATRKLVSVVEPAELHDLRTRALGSPTMRDRRDLAQHFFVASGITSAVGEKLALSASLLKEMNDGKGGTGFSFADLQADLAGMAFAEEVAQSADRLDTWGASFRVAEFLPDHASLDAPLTAEEVYAQYGSVSDKKFQAKLDELRGQIEKTRGTKSEPGKPGKESAEPSAGEKTR
jgi:hypothetical protein